MNTIKTILFSSLLILTSLSSNAQKGLKEPITFKLKNGMNIIISENGNSPKAYASFTLDSQYFQNNKDGIVVLLNAVLNESMLNNNNISFKDNSGKLSTSKADFDNSLLTMATFLENPTLNQKVFNQAKSKLLLSIKLQDYDYDQSVNENSINSLSLTDVKEFYSQIIPEKTYLTIAGNVEISASKASAKKAFGNWKIANTAEVIAE